MQLHIFVMAVEDWYLCSRVFAIFKIIFNLFLLVSSTKLSALSYSPFLVTTSVARVAFTIEKPVLFFSSFGVPFHRATVGAFCFSSLSVSHAR